MLIISNLPGGVSGDSWKVQFMAVRGHSWDSGRSEGHLEDKFLQNTQTVKLVREHTEHGISLVLASVLRRTGMCPL